MDGGFEPDELPYPFWPDPGGLMAFGGADNGDSLLWLTEGAPDDWKVVVWGRGLGEFEVLNYGLTDFLAGLATGSLRPKEFPDDLLPCDCLFAPGKDIRDPSSRVWKLSARLQFRWDRWASSAPSGDGQDR